MRVLWFTSSSSLFPPDKGKNVLGGWVSSLQREIEKCHEIELGIAFFHENYRNQLVQNGVKYYPIFKKKSWSIMRVLGNWNHGKNEIKYVTHFINIIDDFKPDVIQVFGTERSFGLVVHHTKIPVAVHIQGFVNPCLNAWYCPGISTINVLLNESILEFIKGHGVIHDYIKAKVKAKQEKLIISNVKYFMGRTHWDKNLTHILAPSAKYFHIDEMLRPSFYFDTDRCLNYSNCFTIVSILSRRLYKGLDLVFNTLKILNKLPDFEYKWQIFGIDEGSRIVKLLKGKSLNLDKNCIEYHGRTSEKGIYNALINADVFVHPSYIENSPNSVCEAQLIGLPVIATNVGGLASIINHNRDGILVPANDPYALAHQLIEFKNNPQRALSIGKAGREKAKLRHNKEKIIQSLLDTYTYIIKDVIKKE